jgi:hypothetical protein
LSGKFIGSKGFNAEIAERRRETQRGEAATKVKMVKKVK